jgi:hypothetical protein
MNELKTKKAISSVVAAVLITTISVALVGTTYLFSQGLLKGTMAETFEVIDVFSNKIIVRNLGTQEIKEIKTLVDGKEVKNTLEKPIQPGSLGTIILEDLNEISSGKHKLTIISKSMSQTFDWEFEYVTTTTLPEPPEFLTPSLPIKTGTSGKLIGVLNDQTSYTQGCQVTGNCICIAVGGACSESNCYNLNGCQQNCPNPLYPHTHQDPASTNCQFTPSSLSTCCYDVGSGGCPV